MAMIFAVVGRRSRSGSSRRTAATPRPTSARWSSPTSASRSRSSCSACCSPSCSRSSSKDTPFALPPSGRLSAGRHGRPARDRLGPRGPDGPAAGDPRLRLGHVHPQRRSSPASGARLVDAFRHLILPAIALGHDPARDHRPDHPLQPARGPRPRLRPDGPRQGPRRSASWSSATRLRNALLPVVTIIGLQLGALLSGAVLTGDDLQPGGRRARRCSRRSPAATTSSSRASR